jgi:hypothetical protein
MKKEVFVSKAEEMGDFYVYFTDAEGNKTFSVGTADLSTPYIARKLKTKQKRTPQASSLEEVQIWDWNRDRLVTLKFSAISKLVPLSTVLKNGQ